MSTGFSFGAKTTAPPTFGTGSITFGTPAAQQPTQFGFGGLSSSAPSLFSTQTPTTSTLAFGTQTAAPNTGFGLGAPTSQPPSFGFGAPASTAPTFGTPAASTAPTAGGLSFGTPTATSTGGLTFGAASGLSFGAPAASTAGGLTFGAPAASTAGTLSFGAPASSAAPSGLSFGTTPASTGLSFGAASSAPSLGLSFGAASTATAPSLSFGTSTTSTGLNFGTTPASSSFGLGGVNLTTPATQQNVGLGGIASATQSKTGSNTVAQKEVPPKEQPLPNEFIQLVDQFKSVVQEEKNRSSEVARCSVKEFHKVETELDVLNQQFGQVENQLQNNRSLAEMLKFDTAKGLQNIEMAQRTQDTPPSLQYDNTAPLNFFLDLADNFEREMQILKLKIDNTEKFVKKCNEPAILTSQDLAQGMKRLHETFVALAGRMQSVHSQVESQKEIFLSLRKQAIKDNINPFEKIDKNTEAMNTIITSALKSTPPNLASGPTPFNSIALGSNNIAVATQQTNPPPYPSAGNTSTLGFGTGSSFVAQPSNNNTSIFKDTGFGNPQTFQLNTSSSFQLQKPPTGNKRGKQ